MRPSVATGWWLSCTSPPSLAPSGGTAVVELVTAGDVLEKGEARGVEVEWW